MTTRKNIQKSFIAFDIEAPADGVPLLPSDPAAWVWPPRYGEFAQTERTLGAAKSEMDPFEDDRDLVTILRISDLYRGLKARIGRRFGGQAVTRAWMKLYELRSQTDMVRAPERKGAPFRVFHNAELPGAWVAAENHWDFVNMPGVPREWRASSLYPEGDGGPGPAGADGTAGSDGAGDRAKTHVLGDQYGIYQCNRGNWLMGPEHRGDLTSLADIRDMAAQVNKTIGKVDLYTSDAGIDVSGDYLRQEELTARLNLGQVLAGLYSLRRGGSMVTKTYTFLHPFSVSLLAVCAGMFDRLQVTKPLTSAPANSEVYIVGTGFRGLPRDVEARLAGAVTDFDFGSPLVDLGAPGLGRTVESALVAARAIHGVQQVAFLGEAMRFFHRFRDRTGCLETALRDTAAHLWEEWLEANPIEYLPAGERIPMKKGWGKGECA